MVLSKIKNALKSSKQDNERDNQPIILIVEDDAEQMELLASFAKAETQKLLDNEKLKDKQRQNLREVRIIKVSDISSLEKVVSAHGNAILTILDCNIPDEKGGGAHDQFVKENHVITGQHRSVDIIIEHLPSSPIALISSMNRFRNTVNQYYKNDDELRLKFIQKSDSAKIQKMIEYYLNKFLRHAE